MSSKAATGVAAVLAVGAGLLAAWVFKEDIKAAFEGEKEGLLKRCDQALQAVEDGLGELEAADKTRIGSGGLRKMLTACSVDLDFIFSSLDQIKFTNNEGDSLRIKRKALVDRANHASERCETLQQLLPK